MERRAEKRYRSLVSWEDDRMQNYEMKIGGRVFDLQAQTYIMGILNVTPDSFSDGGKYCQEDAALKHVEQMIAEGADVVDVGGESTRPGHQQISVEEEIQRTAPVIAKIKERFDIPISVDTYKTEVARAAIQAGADLINDIWGLKYEENMAALIAESGLPCCLMHNRKHTEYGNFLEDVKSELRETLALAERAGISDGKILLDPGIGFGKTYQQNLEMIWKLQELKELGYPLLLGASRKSVIGLTLDLPVTERVEGTLVTTVFAVMSGCAFVRVHDIKENRRAVQMARAIREGWKEDFPSGI